MCRRQANPLGDHALCCGAAGLWRRHNNLRDVLLNALPKAGLQASVEVSLPHSDARPADLFISQGCGPRPVAVDILVVHPLSSGFHHSEGSAGAAAAKREAEKIAHCGEACRAAGWDFIPVVAETTGAWGLKGQAFFSAVARKQARALGLKVSEVAASIWGSLSMAVARSVANMLLQAGSLPVRLPAEKSSGCV